IVFGCKRAFHSTLRITRPILTAMGLTAARFDMLTAIGRKTYGIPQKCLRLVLGGSAPTISRMLRSLEELGLVERQPYREDRRTRYVVLTERGKARLRTATKELIGTGLVQLAIDCALTYGRSFCEVRCFQAMCNADEVLYSL